jgi:hypothetical protein
MHFFSWKTKKQAHTVHYGIIILNTTVANNPWTSSNAIIELQMDSWNCFCSFCGSGIKIHSITSLWLDDMEDWMYERRNINSVTKARYAKLRSQPWTFPTRVRMTLSSKRNQGQSVLCSPLCPRFHREPCISILLVIFEVRRNRESTITLLGTLPSTG